MTTGDLARGQPCPQGNCPLCLTGDGRGGLHHHRGGAVYKGGGGGVAVVDGPAVDGGGVPGVAGPNREVPMVRYY